MIHLLNELEKNLHLPLQEHVSGYHHDSNLVKHFLNFKLEHLISIVTIDYLYGASFLLIRTTQHMFPLGLCQYLKDQYVFSLGPCCFSFAPFPEDAPTPVPLLLFAS